MNLKRMISTILLLSMLILLAIFSFPDNNEMMDLGARVEKIDKAVPNINYGGCGYFALYLHDYLNQKAINNEIIFLSFKNQLPRHIVIKVGSSYIDNNYFWSEESMMLFSGRDMTVHSREELVSLLHKKGWNEKFNKTDTTIIKQLLYAAD